MSSDSNIIAQNRSIAETTPAKNLTATCHDGGRRAHIGGADPRAHRLRVRTGAAYDTYVPSPYCVRPLPNIHRRARLAFSPLHSREAIEEEEA